MSEKSSSSIAEVTDVQQKRKKELAQRFWQRYFRFYDTLNTFLPYRELLVRQADLLEPMRDLRALDAGTGTGNLAQLLANRGAIVTGIDFCESVLVQCRKKVPKAKFLFGDLTQTLTFKDASFSRLSCSLVLHLLRHSEQQAVVCEFFRVLRPGGTAVITVFAKGFNPTEAYLEAFRQKCRASGITGAVWFGLRYLFNMTRILYYVYQVQKRQKDGEHQFLTSEIFRPMLEQAGFKKIKFELMFAGQCLTAVAIKPEAGLQPENPNSIE